MRDTPERGAEDRVAGQWDAIKVGAGGRAAAAGSGTAEIGGGVTLFSAAQATIVAHSSLFPKSATSPTLRRTRAMTASTESELRSVRFAWSQRRIGASRLAVSCRGKRIASRRVGRRLAEGTRLVRPHHRKRTPCDRGAKSTYSGRCVPP
jgi:hypothetical protein